MCSCPHKFYSLTSSRARMSPRSCTRDPWRRRAAPSHALFIRLLMACRGFDLTYCRQRLPYLRQTKMLTHHAANLLEFQLKTKSCEQQMIAWRERHSAECDLGRRRCPSVHMTHERTLLEPLPPARWRATRSCGRSDRNISAGAAAARGAGGWAAHRRPTSSSSAAESGVPWHNMPSLESLRGRQCKHPRQTSGLRLAQQL